MPLEPLKEGHKAAIVANVLKACKDISKLSAVGYNFLYLASGFIAHYNRLGFKGYYENGDLPKDILANDSANMWYNFRPGDPHFEYYASRADVYRRIVAGLNRMVEDAEVRSLMA
jgi:hypothetical protein